MFPDSKPKQANHLLALKDLLVHNELEYEIDIINELMLDYDSDIPNVMGVNLMTIHKARGLEFKCVFIISVNDGILPLTLKYTDLIEEERRLLYVAMTRAKDYLYLSSAEYHTLLME